MTCPPIIGSNAASEAETLIFFHRLETGILACEVHSLHLISCSVVLALSICSFQSCSSRRWSCCSDFLFAGTKTPQRHLPACPSPVRHHSSQPISLGLTVCRWIMIFFLYIWITDLAGGEDDHKRTVDLYNGNEALKRPGTCRRL